VRFDKWTYVIGGAAVAAAVVLGALAGALPGVLAALAGLLSAALWQVVGLADGFTDIRRHALDLRQCTSPDDFPAYSPQGDA
jgi:hypothetical protein